MQRLRRLTAILCGLILGCVTLSAQNSADSKMYVIDKEGQMKVNSVDNIDSVFFFNGFDDIFSITCSDASHITENSFSLIATMEMKRGFTGFSEDIEVGICFSDCNTEPTISDSKQKLGNSPKEYPVTLKGLDAGTEYFFRAYVAFSDTAYYSSDVHKATTLGAQTLNYKIIDGRKLVDLGLPSGTLWAAYNIGAQNINECGNYYAWGETEPKSKYSWYNYKWGDFTSSADKLIDYDSYPEKALNTHMTKYNFTDDKTRLEYDDDAAYVNWGEHFCMPSTTEFGELVSNCTISEVTLETSSSGKLKCRKFVSKINGNYILLPYTDKCYYWTSTRWESEEYSYNSPKAYSYTEIGYWDNRPQYGIQGSILRYKGRLVRAIAVQKDSSESLSFKEFKLWVAPEDQTTIKGLVNLTLPDSINSIEGNITVGICWSSSDSIPVVGDNALGVATVSTLANKVQYSYPVSCDRFSPNTKYWLRSYIMVDGETYYGSNVVEVTTPADIMVKNKVINGHKFVNLGLPSGKLWALTNIGADTPADAGEYYEWSDTKAMGKSSGVSYNKYTETDKKTVLEPQDDAAYVNWGDSCSTPSPDDFKELCQYCDTMSIMQVTIYGDSIKCLKLTSKVNGNNIFLPAAGYKHSSYMYKYGIMGCYMTNTQDTPKLNRSGLFYDYFYFINSFGNLDPGIGIDYRATGTSVRPVANNYDDQGSVFAKFTQEATPVSDVSIKGSVIMALADSVSFSGNISVGVCWSKVSVVPNIEEDNVITLKTMTSLSGTDEQTFEFSQSGLTEHTVYYLRSFIKFGERIIYTDSVTTVTTPWRDNSRVINGHKFVDLHLPSGLLWAETNIGANSSTDTGDLFAWGETTSKTKYTWKNYNWANDDETITKYLWTTPQQQVLEDADDAAKVNWGDSCRMPTYEEFSELRNTNVVTWTESSNGYLLTGVNGNSIFISNQHDNLWSSTLCPFQSYASKKAYSFTPGNDTDFMSDREDRYLGRPVRAVAKVK